jgi:hypothetical protein
MALEDGIGPSTFQGPCARPHSHALPWRHTITRCGKEPVFLFSTLLASADAVALH